MASKNLKTYWNGMGKYQSETDLLNKLIPEKGESPVPKIELFRCASNIYYDYHNNGFCNKDNYATEVARVYKYTNIELAPWGGESEDKDGNTIILPEEPNIGRAEIMMNLVMDLILKDEPLWN